MNNEMDLMEMKALLERRSTEKAQLEGEYNAKKKANKELYGTDVLEELEELIHEKEGELRSLEETFQEGMRTLQDMEIWN